MTTRAERATVLAVDDRRESRQRYERRLGDDFEVVTAASGEAALDVLPDGVDVVLLHQDLPDTGSDDVLFSIRTAGYDCRVAKITEQEPTEDVIEAGFDAVLVEPATADELREIVERLLARSSYETQLDELYSLCVKRAKARADGGVDGSHHEECSSPGDGSEGRDDACSVDPSEVAEIEARIREIRTTVDETVSMFETSDYRASFRDLAESG